MEPIRDIISGLRRDYRDKLAAWRSGTIEDKYHIAMCKEKINDFEESRAERKQFIDALYKRYVATGGDERDWLEWLLSNEKKRLQEDDRQLQKWTAFKLIAERKVQKTELNIAAAKEVPIARLLEGIGRKSSRNLFFSCFLHADNTPSFCIYLDSNEAHCFSCGFHGDVIDVYMKKK